MSPSTSSAEPPQLFRYADVGFNIAQAGMDNFNDGTISDGFGDDWESNGTEFYVYYPIPS
jgi:hypothetical protein